LKAGNRDIYVRTYTYCSGRYKTQRLISLTFTEVRERIEGVFSELSEGDLSFERRDQMVGHAAGIFVRNKIKEILSPHLDVLEPEDFLAEKLNPHKAIFANAIDKRDFMKRLIIRLKGKWWWKLCFRSKSKVESYLSTNQTLGYKQEDTPDIIIGLSQPVFLNIKSHNLEKKSRPPNIMSAKKLLDLFAWITSQNPSNRTSILENIALLFVGVSWRQENHEIKFKSIEVRDLFALDLDQLPTINFDAAIQIQWHVSDMVELAPPLPRLNFVEKFVTTFNERWGQHVSKRSKSIRMKTDQILNWVHEDSAP